MNINFAQPMKTAFGKDLLLEDKTVATLGDVAAIALGAAPRSEQLSTEESYLRGKLAQRIVNAITPESESRGEIDLTGEEVARAKKAVAQYWVPGVVVTALDALEGK